MKLFKCLVIVLSLALCPINVQAQFFKKLLKTVSEVISDKDDSTSPRSLAPKPQKETKTETIKKTPESLGITAKLTDINVEYVNLNANFPLLHVGVTSKYKQITGGGLTCYLFVDYAPLQRQISYKNVIALKDAKCYGKIELSQSFDDTKPWRNDLDITIDERRCANVEYQKLYVMGYIVHDETQSILDTKSYVIDAANLTDIPSSDSGELGKILNMKVIGIRSFSDCQKLYVDVTFWRQYTNTPFYCLLFATETPLNINTVAALKPLTVKVPFGTGTKKGVRYSYGEKCIVSIPIPNSMQGKKLYLQGYAVTEKYTKTAGKTVGKPFIAHKTPSTIVNLADYEVLPGMEGADELAKLMTQSMFSELWGIDRNGNMICKHCDGLGCIECRWRGYNNKELLFFQKQKYGNRK